MTNSILLDSQDVIVGIEETMDEDDDDGIVMDESEIMSNGDLQMLLDGTCSLTFLFNY